LQGGEQELEGFLAAALGDHRLGGGAHLGESRAGGGCLWGNIKVGPIHI